MRPEHLSGEWVENKYAEIAEKNRRTDHPRAFSPIERSLSSLFETSFCV